MGSPLLAVSLIASAFVSTLTSVDVELKTTGGQSLQGSLTSATSSFIVLEENGKSVETSSDRILSLQRVGVEDNNIPASPLTVRLQNESRIAARKVQYDGSEVLVTPRRQDELKFSTKSVRAIRFAMPSEATDAAWLGFIGEPSVNDRMIIRREGDRLDAVSGIIKSIDDEKVVFDLDGDDVNAPRERLEGVLFASLADAPDNNAKYKLLDNYGGRWNCDSLAYDEDRGWKITLGSMEHVIPSDQWRQIEFASSMKTLTSLSPASIGTSNPFNIQLSDQASKSSNVVIQPSNNTISMIAGGRIRYRVPKDMTQVMGIVRRPERVAAGSKVRVFIEDEDGKQLWTSSIVDRETIGFELPLEGIRSVVLAVEDESDGDGDGFGVLLEWSELRFNR